MISLANGDVLTVTIDYQGQSSPDIVTATVSGLISATDPMPATPVPANVMSAFQVVDLGQGPNSLYYEQGFVHLVVTATSGLTFDPATFNQVVWGLSDQAGLAWDSTAATLGHNHLYASLRSGTNNVVDLYFPPARDEAPASGSTAPTMTLTALVPGSSTVYATDFVGRQLESGSARHSSRQPARPQPEPHDRGPTASSAFFDQPGI